MTDCVFCRIINGEETAEDFRRIPGVVSFIPLNPVTEGHRLFVPTMHARDAGIGSWGAGAAFEDAADWGREQGEDFNLITSAGAAATQTIFHTHIHYVPRREGDGLHLPWTGQVKNAG